MSSTRTIASLALVGVTASMASAQFRTLFTGTQAGVDLDIPFVGSSGMAPFNAPPFDVDGGSIVNTKTPFTLGGPAGTPKMRVAFAGGGMATHFGNGALYRFDQGGRNAWSVRGSGTGRIKFSPAASGVNIFARGTNAKLVSPPSADIDQDGVVDFKGFGKLQDAKATLTAFDREGNVIASHKVSNEGYELFVFNGEIAGIELTNHAAADAKNSFAIIGEVVAKPEGACVADLDLDGDADAEDFFLYLDAFDADKLGICDVDGDGDCDADDFFGYLDSFAGGC